MSRTRLVVTTLIIIAGIYDLIVVLWFGTDASISRLFVGIGCYPTPVFALGYIMGHFFGWMKIEPQERPKFRGGQDIIPPDNLVKPNPPPAQH